MVGLRAHTLIQKPPVRGSFQREEQCAVLAWLSPKRCELRMLREKSCGLVWGGDVNPVDTLEDHPFFMANRCPRQREQKQGRSTTPGSRSRTDQQPLPHGRGSDWGLAPGSAFHQTFAGGAPIHNRPGGLSYLITLRGVPACQAERLPMARSMSRARA